MDTIVHTQEQVRQIVAEELEQARKNISENIEREGKRASGKTQESMVVSVTDEGTATVGTLSGRAFFGALETGSKPWATQYKRVPLFFAEIIGDWIADKGLDLNPFAVATKIMRKGSKQYREGAITTVYSEEIDATLERINKRVMGVFDATIAESIKRTNNE
ncbi:MAG: hypothetical protein IIV16_03325 [Alistipes sp.]|nr:hypothetical protein [Alistipes sp.]